MIETQNLCKRYGKFTAVDHLNLQIRRGTVFGIVGENGAGKTTTLSMFATLTSPTSGRAYVNGYDITEQSTEVRRSIGYMPDAFGVYDDITAEEYLQFYADCYRVPKHLAVQRAREYLAWVGLEDKRETYVNALSRGMQQRLEIARCLIHDPPVLILDEPASGLDPRSRIEMRSVLSRLRTLGKTIVMSSHILHELCEICDEIAILRAGQLAAVAAVPVLLNHSSAYRTLRIQGQAPYAVWERALAGACQVREVRYRPDGVELVFAGSLPQQGELLQRLLAEGVQVYQFVEQATDIEELFLRLTEGPVNSQ
ncbi:ABC transporter [Alicyclobacillus contaminans]|uniref:ABC transporter ATP-binding protein n=1 Tax=Alicyclobacillus contaminans TaxID=392016 RepID=UPI0004229AE5|nr:ABC transporter ATP-binding protein [Alicyclobacillus contaminans]GMA52086.1 ABC transporter [Alicyclobacillus contaminans]